MAGQSRAGCRSNIERSGLGRLLDGLDRAARRAALFVFVWLAFGIAACSDQSNSTERQLTLRTASGDSVIAIEIAETDAQKSLGLMYRTSVPQMTGMLFPYGSPQEITMWMRNTYVSLDMVFIRADGVVHRIEAHTEPLSERIIASQGPVTAVLELAAGEAERLKLRPGDRVLHPAFKNGAGKATGATGK
jgi:uncharacterized membrane protein (UPF0127 family)